jgi:hypothetical protein
VLEFPPLTPSTDQVTAVFEVPETVSLNCCVPPGATVAEVGLIEMETPPPLLVTVMFTPAWYTWPAESQVCARTLWEPGAMLKEVLTVAVFALLKTTTLSTYTQVDPTALLVLACERYGTGEATDAPFTGLQIFTLFTTVFVHPPPPLPTVMFTPAW